MRFFPILFVLLVVVLSLACGGFAKQGNPGPVSVPDHQPTTAENRKKENPALLTEPPPSKDSLELKPVVMKKQFDLKNVDVQLSCIGHHKVPDADLGLLSVDMVLKARLIESTEKFLPQRGAQFKEEFQRFKYDIHVNNEQQAHDEILKKTAEGLTLSYQEDAKGTFGSKQVHTAGTALQLKGGPGRLTLDNICLLLLRGFEMTSTVPPDGLVQPGQSWQAQLRLPTPLALADTQPPLMDVTYKYLGLKRLKGRAVAVVSVHGLLSNETRSGNLTGTVLFDPETGMVVQGKATTELTMTLENYGLGGRSPGVVSGSLEIEIQRGFGID